MLELKVALIAAHAKNRVIGQQGKLPWPQIKDDFAYFKQKTTGHPVIMGSKTYLSIPEKFRPLPDRTNIVLSHGSFKGDGKCIVVDSIHEALKAAAAAPGYEETFVIGGAKIYEAFLPYAHTLYLTDLNAEYPEGDTFFPEFSPTEWQEDLKARNTFPQNERNAHAGTFRVYRSHKKRDRVVVPEVARSKEYRADLLAINALSLCPFCPGGTTIEKQQMLLENASWYVSFNYQPLPASKYHFLFIAKRHAVRQADLSGKDFENLTDLIEKLKEKYCFTTGFLYGREGTDPEAVGASVYHLHMHYIVPEDGKAVIVYFGPFSHEKE